jgi:hypothetical protein
MRTFRRPPRPKQWTMGVIGSCKYLHNDRIEILLNFRKEYRQYLKVSRAHADQFARAEAARAVWEALKFAVKVARVIGPIL